jgi:alpha-beta hydrolase superfamily lysophospholipase
MPSTVDAMKASPAQRPAGAPDVEFVVYPDAVHDLFADYRDDYHPHGGAGCLGRALA